MEELHIWNIGLYLAISYDVYRVFNKSFSTIDDLECIITVQIILIMELQLNKEIDDEILNLN